MFASWGSTVYRGRWIVLVVVLLASIGSGLWGLGVFDRFSQGGYDDPNSEAARATKLIDDNLGEQNSGDLVVIYTAPSGSTVDSADFAAQVTAKLDSLPSDAVSGITSYWKTPTPQLASSDKQSGIALVTLAGGDIDTKVVNYEEVKDDFGIDGVESYVAGEAPIYTAMNERSEQDLTRAEMISLPIVMVLLVIIFGGLIAASLPILVGGLAVFASLGVLNAISHATDVNNFAVNVASLLGLGLAIDYGLFMVGRFREELADGRSNADAVRRTVATAGRTVLFSATLLIVALAGLLLFPQAFLRSLSYGGMAAVGIAAVISLTLLPAILGLLGHRVDKLSLPWLKRKRSSSDSASIWHKLATGVMKRPLAVAVPIILLLLLLGTPVFSVQFGQPDERGLPAGDSARVAAEVLKDRFPAMSDNSVQVVLHGTQGAPPDAAAIEQFSTKLNDVDGVVDVAPGGAGKSVVVLKAAITGDPFGDKANTIVSDIRALDVPAGTELVVGGITAYNLDSLDAVGAALPWMLLIVGGATIVLMFLAFGSVVLPLKAVIMSILSLSATFGVLVWIFVDGHGADLLGVTPSPVEIGIVILMASVVFGLSTDYEVFLLSRMVEARENGASSEDAVRTGLVRTGRMITAAALLLIVVTGAFALSGLTMMRFIGIGMILALALDATVVRMLLVPAIMKLLGDKAWWAPGPLKRLQAKIGMGERELAEEPESVRKDPVGVR